MCFSGATQDRSLFLLQSLAEGDVFGKKQCLQMLLHDNEQNSDELAELAQDFQEACYPLITGVQSNCDTLQCFPTSDFIFLLLDTDDMNAILEAVQKWAVVFRSTSGIKLKAVALVSHKAALAVAALTFLCPELNPDLLIAVELPKQSSSAYCQRNGTYKMVQSVCQTVKSWLVARSVSDTKEERRVNVNEIALHCFLSLPEQIPTLPASLCKITSTDWEMINGLVEELATACSTLQLSKQDMVTSFLDAKL